MTVYNNIDIYIYIKKSVILTDNFGIAIFAIQIWLNYERR